jgi:HAD superfamily hydrolase (TIGR01509 family)
MKHIVFDLGNVLLNINSDESIKKLSFITGADSKTVLEIMIKTSEKSGYEKGFCSDSDFYYASLKNLFKIRNNKSTTNTRAITTFSSVQNKTENLAAFKKKLSFNLFYNLWNNIFTPNIEMFNIIAELAPKYSLTLLSNTNKMHFDFCINKWPILKMFENYVLSYNLGYIKPQREIYRYLINTCLKTNPENIIFFDDLEENINAAKDTGINAHVYSSPEDVKKKISDFIVNTPKLIYNKQEIK